MERCVARSEAKGLSDCATIVEVLRRRAGSNAAAPAFSFLANGETTQICLSYGELDARARAIARSLCARGCAGRRVLLVFPSGIDFVAALFGCFYAGVVAVPIPVPIMLPQRAFTRALQIMKDARACTALSCASLLQAMPELEALRAVEWIDIAEIESDEAASVPAGIDGNAVALLQYTSGTTSIPRGVMLTHANLMHNQMFLTRAVQAGPEDRAVCWLPLYHDMGLIGAILHTVCAGGACALMSPLSFLQRPMRWLEAISAFRATISMAPTFAFELCARRADRRDPALDLSSWRVAICGGETIRPETLENFATAFAPAGFHASSILPCYGLAESTLLATAGRPGEGMIVQEPAQDEVRDAGGIAGPSARRRVCCGQAGDGHALAIVDPETCRRVPHGECGEIWLRGPSVAQGYWMRDADTEETFRGVLAEWPQEGSWLRTGDLGFLSSDGLYVTGRRKDLIIVRGANLDPLDLEIAVSQCHPSLSNGAAAAFSLEREDGEAVVLVHEIDRAAMKQPDMQGIVDQVARTMSRNFGLTLHDLVLLRPGSLPRTTSGKVQRQVCKQSYASGELAAVATLEHPALGRCRRTAAGLPA
ncbi:MAG TPA: fatty acyl-AMP ligase [Rhizomicrobium sp.]|jgi:acyl-CoA synthetase (AMP-forming)/AMP-acid ligase II